MRAINRSPHQPSWGRHSPTVTHDSSGEAAVVCKLPMRATCLASFTPSPISGNTTRSVVRTRRSDPGSTAAMSSGARRRITLTFFSALRV
jgi:hypothetical protein